MQSYGLNIGEKKGELRELSTGANLGARATGANLGARAPEQGGVRGLASERPMAGQGGRELIPQGQGPGQLVCRCPGGPQPGGRM